MKSKTNFKQMYLVDATAYNNRIDAPIILGRSNNPPPTINVLAPVTSGVDSGYPIHTELKSVGTQSNVLNTKSTGVVTEPPPNKADQASQTRKLQYRSPQNNNRLSQDDNRSSRDNNRLSQPQDSQNFSENSNLQIEPNSQISKKEIPLNTHLQYIVPDPEFQKAMDFTTMQPQTQPQLMDNNTPASLVLPQQPMDKNTIQYSAPLALPQPQQPWNYNNIQYSAPLALPQPQQQLMEYSVSPQTNQLQQSQTQPQLMDYSSNTQTPRYPPLPQPQLMDHSSNTQTPCYPALPQPQLMDYSSNTQTPHYPTLPQPQPMDYNVNPQNSALPAPVDDDCTECAVTKYKRYDVSLPSKRGLPENSLFICTLCESNFSTKESLQRHMKNIHDAFNQVEKGIKRKAKQGKISKKLKTSHEVVPYLLYANPT